MSNRIRYHQPTPEQAGAQRLFAITRGHGCIETAVIAFLNGTITWTAAEYIPAMAPKTLLDCAALALASSNPKVYAASPKKCDRSRAVYARSLTIY